MPKRTPTKSQFNDNIVTTYSKGIRNIGEFNGSIRCMEVHGGKVWTGEADGSIAIRNAASGAILNTIERKPNIFVNCLLCQGFYMWAGLSDGTILIYNPEKFEVACSIKQHAGAITCLVGSAGRVYSGSSDWRINAWDSRSAELPEEAIKKNIVQFTGHQNSIRCLAVDERYLFSGGDDCSIRCWDVDTATERQSPFPITAHKSPITALATHEVYLFSASSDGTVKVWNIQNGALAKNITTHQGPVKCLLKDPVAQRIWSGDSEGVIIVWDAVTLNQVSKLLDHSGAFVSSMKLLTRVTALKVWTVGANGIVKVWYSETDAPKPDYTEMNRLEEELQGTIEAMRGTIIQNYQELEQYKTDLSKWKTRDERSKQELELILGQQQQQQQLKQSYGKLMEWIAKRRRFNKRYEIAELLQRSNSSTLTSIYFRKWSRFLTVSKELKRKNEVSQSLERFTDLGLATIYMKKLVEYSSARRYKRKRRTLATLLQHVSQRTLAAVFFNKWRRWYDGRKLMEKQSIISESLVRASNRAFMSMYFQRLLNFARREEERERRVLAAHTLWHVNGRIIIRRHYNMWMQWIKIKKRQRFQQKIKDALDTKTNQRVLFRYYSKWLAWAHKKGSKKLVARIQNERDKMSWLRKALRLSDTTPDELVRTAIDDLVLQVQNLRDEVNKVHGENERLTDLNRMYVQAFGGGEGHQNTGRELSHIMNLLKATVLNVLNDYKLILEVREREKSEGAINMFVEAYMVIKCYVEDMVQSERKEMLGDQWHLTKDEIYSLAYQNSRAFLHSMKEMVLCYDIMLNEEKDELLQITDVAQNGAHLMEIAEVSLKFTPEERPTRNRKKSVSSPRLPPSSSSTYRQRMSFGAMSVDHLGIPSNMSDAGRRRKSMEATRAKTQMSSKKDDRSSISPVDNRKQPKKLSRSWSSASRGSMSPPGSVSKELVSRSSSRSSMSSQSSHTFSIPGRHSTSPTPI